MFTIELVIVAGVIKENKLTRPIPQEKLQDGYRLLVTGNSDDIEKMIEEEKEREKDRKHKERER